MRSGLRYSHNRRCGDGVVFCRCIWSLLLGMMFTDTNDASGLLAMAKAADARPLPLFCATLTATTAFIPHTTHSSSKYKVATKTTPFANNGNGDNTSTSSGVNKVNTNTPKRIARRDLKKRRNKRNRAGNSVTLLNNNNTNDRNSNNKSSTTTTTTMTVPKIEKRPLIRSQIIEAGEDYWIDEEELQRSIQNQQRRQLDYDNNNNSNSNIIAREKLKTEVVAPYKQNWIGLMSVMVVVISVIGSQFPELMQSPIIPIPDL